MAKSYYAILGTFSMATTDEVRAAYRRLAKAYHPDVAANRSGRSRKPIMYWVIRTVEN
jgi:curved DNA-binding protein